MTALCATTKLPDTATRRSLSSACSADRPRGPRHAWTVARWFTLNSVRIRVGSWEAIQPASCAFIAWQRRRESRHEEIRSARRSPYVADPGPPCVTGHICFRRSRRLASIGSFQAPLFYVVILVDATDRHKASATYCQNASRHSWRRDTHGNTKR